MSYKIIQGAYNMDEFYCDKIADLENLPKSSGMGSIAYVIENGTTYILNSDKEWKVKVGNSTGGSTGGTTVVEYDDTELRELIATEKGRMDAFMSAAQIGDAAIDKLSEIQDYIIADGEAAAQMTSKIALNEADIDVLKNKPAFGITSEDINKWNTPAENVEVDLTDYAKKDEIPSKTSQLTNDSGFLTSANIPASDKFAGLAGKKISFMGDSITTFSGTMPSGYATYYPAQDITTVDKTWWHQVVTVSGMNLLVNGAWSGSRVTGASTTMDTRVADLSKDGVAPDIIVMLMGINDFGNNVALGEWDGASIPAEGTISTFAPAYALTVKKMIEKYPSTEVFLCTLPVATNYFDKTAGYPMNQSDGTLLRAYNDMIVFIARAFGCKTIDMHACGIHYFNNSVYMNDQLHPNAAGAKLMASQALADLSAKSIFNSPLVVETLPPVVNPDEGGDETETPDEGGSEVEIPTAETWYYNDLPATTSLDAPSVARADVTAFAYNDEVNTLYTNKPVNALKLAVNTAGDMSYGKVSANEFTTLGTIALTNPSKEYQVFNIPEVTCADGEKLWFQGGSDTGLFWHAQKVSSKFAAGVKAATPNGNTQANGHLSIGIGYISAE